MTEITPYRIAISDAELQALHTRLQLTRFPDAETTGDWNQGIPLAYMKEVHAYWRDHYDWRRCEEALNALPQFVTPLDGLDIHFLHVRSRHDGAMPLVITHGWPGSVIEFLKVIPLLTDPTTHGGSEEDAFHLVCPTLPGFGFSGKPTQPGWNIERVATAWNTLMVRLGYDRYLAQGGDWGSAVTAAIAEQNLGNCVGVHMNMPIVGPDRDTLSDLTELEQAALKAAQFYQDHDSGYSKQQSTRPQTLGYGLADSPIGQAAWILEKFYQWTDCDGHPENVLTRDELLDNVMMYWLTNSGASSARIYWESFGRGGSNDPVTVPTGCSIFPKEIFKTSRRWAERRYQRLVHFNELDKGGHFAAMEQPDLFVSELRECFRHMRG